MTDELELEKLRQFCRENPQDLDSGLNLIQRCADLGWFNEALDICRRLLNTHESDYSLLLEYGNILYKHNDLQDAKLVFLKLTKLKPERIEGWNNLGILELASGGLDAAGRAFNQVLELEPQNAGALLNVGNYYSEKGDIHKATFFFEQATSVKADFPEAWYNLGNSYLFFTNYLNAKKAFEKALYYDQRFGSAYKNLGFTCEKLGDFDKALEYYLKAFELNRADAGIQINIAEIYMHKSHLQDALNCCRRAVRLAPGEPSGWFALRRVALRLKDGAAFVRATLAVISRLDDAAVAQSIFELREMECDEEAQKLLEHADRLSRGGNMLDALRLVLYRKKRLQPGLTTVLFRRLSTVHNSDPLILKCLAEYAFMAGSYERVIIFLEPLEDLSLRCRLLHWRSLIKTGKSEQAEKLALEYLEANADSFECLLLLAELRAAAHDENEARSYLVKACSSGKRDFQSLKVNPILLKIYKTIEAKQAAVSIN